MCMCVCARACVCVCVCVGSVLIRAGKGGGGDSTIFLKKIDWDAYSTYSGPNSSLFYDKIMTKKTPFSILKKL